MAERQAQYPEKDLIMLNLIKKEPEGGLGGGQSCLMRGYEVWYRSLQYRPNFILCAPPLLAAVLRPFGVLHLLLTYPRGNKTREQHWGTCVALCYWAVRP